MQITDPIADMLTRIRNAGSARHETVDVPNSKMKKAIAEILLEEGYIKSFQLIDDGTQGVIRITLKYLPGKEKAIQGLRRVSKPGLRVYAGADELPQVLHGLTRTLIHNMVIGVTEGFSKTLEINGVGYRAVKEGQNLVMHLGFSHTVTVSENADIQIDVPNPNQVIIKGIDKEKVGQFAAEVRAKRPPEPYKGKGIKYDYEHIRRKEGKTGAK